MFNSYYNVRIKRFILIFSVVPMAPLEGAQGLQEGAEQGNTVPRKVLEPGTDGEDDPLWVGYQ